MFLEILESLPNLSVEVAGERRSGIIDKPDVAGQPHRLAAPTAGENEYFASQDGSMIVFFNGI
jgi:hypothetical protein